MIKITTLAAAATVMAIGIGSVQFDVSSDGRVGGSVLAQEAAKLWPDGMKKAASEFETHLTQKFLAPSIEKWQKERSVARQTSGVQPRILTSTVEHRGEWVRTYYYIDSFDKKGAWLVRKGDILPGHGLVFGPIETMNFKRTKLDEVSLELLYPYTGETRNDADGNKLVAGFAAWLYENGAEWAGNRALHYLSMRNRAMQDDINKAVRELNKLPPEEALTSQVGVGFAKWAELIPASKKAEREEAREAACKQELAVAARRGRLSLAAMDEATWESMATPPKLVLGTAAAPVGLSLLALEREMDIAARFADGSLAWQADIKLYEDNSDSTRPSKEVQATFNFVRAEVKARQAKAKVVRELAEKKYEAAGNARRVAGLTKKEGGGSGDREAWFKIYDEAEVELRKLVPTKSSPAREKPLDPFEVRNWYVLAECLRYTCRPDEQSPDRPGKESIVRELLVAANVALRYGPGNGNTLISRGNGHMMLKQYKEAEADFKAVAENETQPKSLRDAGKQHLETLEKVVKVALEKQKIKHMGKKG